MLTTLVTSAILNPATNLAVRAKENEMNVKGNEV